MSFAMATSVLGTVSPAMADRTQTFEASTSVAASNDEAHQQSNRRAFGLEDSLQHVRQVRSLPDTQASTHWSGLRLTKVEALQRQTVESAEARIGLALAELGSSQRAGFWRDGLIYKIGTVGEAPLGRRQAASKVLGAPVEFVQQRFSSSALRKLEEQIKFDLLAAGLTADTSVGIDERRNLVSVWTTSRSQVENALSSDVLGDALEVVEMPSVEINQEGNRDFGYPPLYAGQWINTLQSNSRCTASVSNVRSNTNPTNSYILTAGHCGQPGEAWYMGYQQSKTWIGSFTKIPSGLIQNGSTNCDCKIIGPHPDGTNVRSRRALVNNNDLWTYSAAGRPPQNGDAGSFYVGRETCISGAQQYTSQDRITCDNIAYDGREVMSSGDGAVTFKLTDAVWVHIVDPSKATSIGDSGAPVGNGGNFLGIHSGSGVFGVPNVNSPQIYRIFSKASNIGPSLNVHFDWGVPLN